MITAPNSLMPRANIRIKPETMLRQAKGSEMVKNTLAGEAPSVRAAFSSLTGTPINPSRAAFIRNGRLTNAMARAIPAGCPTKFSPIDDPIFPTNESRETNPSMAIPAAECGITTGKSIIPETMLFNGNSFRASKYASGIAAIAKKMVAASETQIVSFMLCCTSKSHAVANKSDGLVETNIPTKGATINRSIKAPARLIAI